MPSTIRGLTPTHRAQPTALPPGEPSLSFLLTRASRSLAMAPLERYLELTIALSYPTPSASLCPPAAATEAPPSHQRNPTPRSIFFLLLSVVRTPEATLSFPLSLLSLFYRSSIVAPLLPSPGARSDPLSGHRGPALELVQGSCPGKCHPVIENVLERHQVV